MNLRTKLRALGAVTVIGLGLVALVTIDGLNAIKETEETAHRRQAYVADLIEIKASALSTIMLDPAAKETRELFSQASARIERIGNKSIDIIRRQEVREELKKILAQWKNYLSESQQLIRLAESDAKAAGERVVSLHERTFKPFQDALERFVEVRVQEAASGVEQAKAVSNKVFWQVAALLTAVSVINILAVTVVTLAMRSGLNLVMTPMPALRSGDLTHQIPTDRQDEFGEIAAGINSFIHELRQLIQHTRDRAHVLASSAGQLAAASEGLLRSSSQQNDATASVAASVEQFSTSIDQVSDNSGQAEQKAKRSGDLSQSVGEEVLRVVADFQRIEQAVSEAAQQMQGLGNRARDISSIANVIKDVADQTNLLALNAAIEAARAGEQGRGFAVVADEVRKLAERTNQSAQEITEMVTSVQKSTEATSAVMDEGRQLVIQSVHQIEQAGQSMEQVSEASVGVVSAIGEISTALREQRSAGTEIAQNVERIAQMTEVGKDSAAGVAAAALQMTQVAEQLQQDVARFRL